MPHTHQQQFPQHAAPYAPRNQDPKRSGNKFALIFGSVAIIATIALIFVFMFPRGNTPPPEQTPVPSPEPIANTHRFIVANINPAEQRLNGGVFFLFSYSQTYNEARASINGMPVEPIMVAISGGLAGTAIGSQPDDVSNADWDLIFGTGSQDVNTGEAIFHNLPSGTYYLYHVIAPYDYRRIVGLFQIRILEETAEIFCITCDSYDLYNCMDYCERIFVHRVNFTNTRPFLL